MHSDLIKCFFSKSGEINEKVELWHRICDGFPVKICLSLQKDRLYYYFPFPSRILKGIKTIYYTKKNTPDSPWFVSSGLVCPFLSRKLI